MPPDTTVTEWADGNRRLSSENSAEAGQWRTARTPYLAEIMDAFTEPAVHKIVVVASSQVGKTEALLNMLGYVIDIDPGPVMWVTPTNDNAEDFSKRRLAPAIRDCKPLKRKVATAKGRSAANTTLKKRFPGGMLTMTGSNSPANLASVPARYVFGDEIDRWAKDAGGEGNPAGLLEARTATFYNSKIVMVSTPTTRGSSTIEVEYMQGTQEYWSAACPHCGEYRFITFDNIRFEHERITEGSHERFIIGDIAYCCPACGCLSTEKQMRDAEHKWIAKNPDAATSGTRSFWINAFLSPWMSWEHIIRRFLEAGDDPSKLKTVFNTLFGQLWEERGDIADVDELAEAREDYEAELPDGVLCLTCGVDTQDNRLEYEVVGHGLFEETWGIQRGVIWGRPDTPDSERLPNVWSQLDDVIDRQWQYKDGQTLKISLTFVDSGGHHTQDVYRECAKRLGKRVFAIKGKGGEGVPFTPSKPSKQEATLLDARGRSRNVTVWLYVLGVDAGKEKIMSALTVQTPGARYCHFPTDKARGYDAAFFDGLTSERMVLNSSEKWVWKKVSRHKRNEALDCRNYALAAFSALNPDMAKLERARRGATDQPVKKARRRRVSKGFEV
ncbi:MAG: phage terminase large subunit family protein [Eggerthellaceae bacterium]|nr:phage terminase large subunit family protein [Eggerthellaceae bacterium]